MRNSQKVREKALQKELAAVQKQESRMAAAAQKERPNSWKNQLEAKLPPKVYAGLESAFCKGFSLVFRRGGAIIEKGFDKESVQADHRIRDFAVQVKGGRRELKAVTKGAKRADLGKLAVTTVEGIGLGALGIGMPDIVLFLGNLLGGIYETALHYGFEYESRWEQMLILKMMAASLSTGPEWTDRNAGVEELLTGEPQAVSDEAFQTQIRETASVFAMDMLLLKFLQGLPVVGILGGAANPVYYHKVMKYVQLKYRKRYLERCSF